VPYPALDVQGVDNDLALAIVDDCSPTGAEEQDGVLTIFFSDAVQRDRARVAIMRGLPAATTAPREVDDEKRKHGPQVALEAVTVGRLTISDHHGQRSSESLTITIQASMGFGTGHHATTRLCLAALQTLNLADRSVLDVGTGSGILAITARALGARQALGVDNDPDAVRAAWENLERNPDIDGVRFAVADLSSTPLPQADVVTANLTFELLERAAGTLLGAVRPGGALVLSGVQADERSAIGAAFRPAVSVWAAEEDGWVGLVLRAPR
jgi:ribosomal protein L11 methyltransferase